MTKTQCNKCLFANTVSSNKACEFDIPSQIKNIKQISIIDDFYEIENYQCLYGFGKKQYNENLEHLKDIDLHKFITDRVTLKYYLILDTRSSSLDQLQNTINEINNLTIKPKKCSLIINPDHADEIYEYVKNNLSCDKWTVHAFIETLPLNDCINIILDTNLSTSGSWCLLFIDAHHLKPNELSDTTDNLQKLFIIQQSSFHGCYENRESLHKLCLNCAVYKALVSTINRNILKGIAHTPEIILENYDEIY